LGWGKDSWRGTGEGRYVGNKVKKMWGKGVGGRGPLGREEGGEGVNVKRIKASSKGNWLSSNLNGRGGARKKFLDQKGKATASVASGHHRESKPRKPG